MSRWLTRLLLVVGLLAGLVSVGPGVRSPASGQLAIDDVDPFPLGVCVRADKVDPRPLCVLIDPDDPKVERS